MLTADKGYMLETRLGAMMRREGLPSIDALALRLRAPRAEALIADMVEALTTNESSFFRDGKPFDHLKKLLPKLVAARPAGQAIRIWSAACSSGQEAYSVAILAAELGARSVAADAILTIDTDLVSPNALGAILDETTIGKLKAKVVAGGANNQLAVREDGRRVHERGIVYAPDYVINAGGIINVGLEYLGQGDEAEVMARIARIPERLDQVWDESEASGQPASDVADGIAKRLIGRG